MFWDIFWTSWEDVGRIVVTAVVGYLVLVALIRFVGKRTTSRMNNFDWIITVSVGSIFASMVILKSVSMVNGLLAVTLLLGFQFLVTFSTSHWEWARRFFLSKPHILYCHGTFRHAAMRRERVSEAEIIAAVRQSGAGSLDNTAAVVLESDAKLSVVRKGENEDFETIEPVEGFAEDESCVDDYDPGIGNTGPREREQKNAAEHHA
jgi:uncharacterized membrane protein YcaP (DUF421 family)